MQHRGHAGRNNEYEIAEAALLTLDPMPRAGHASMTLQLDARNNQLDRRAPPNCVREVQDTRYNCHNLTTLGVNFTVHHLDGVKLTCRTLPTESGSFGKRGRTKGWLGGGRELRKVGRVGGWSGLTPPPLWNLAPRASDIEP